MTLTPGEETDVLVGRAMGRVRPGELHFIADGSLIPVMLDWIRNRCGDNGRVTLIVHADGTTMAEAELDDEGNKSDGVSKLGPTLNLALCQLLLEVERRGWKVS
jgi:hypothetical protein